MRFLPKSTLRLVAKDMQPAAGATPLATLSWMMTVIVAFPDACCYFMLLTLWESIPLPLFLTQGIGADVQRPLVVDVVFGLTTSTLLTLFIIPAVYVWVKERVERKSPA